MLLWLAELGMKEFRYLTVRSLAAIVLGFSFFIWGRALIGSASPKRLRWSRVSQTVLQVEDGTVFLFMASFLFAVLVCANLANPFVWIVVCSALSYALVGIFERSRFSVGKATAVAFFLPTTLRTTLLVIITVVALTLCFANQRLGPVLAIPFLKDITIQLNYLVGIVLNAILVIGMAFAAKWTAQVDEYAPAALLVITLPLMIISYTSGNVVFAEYLQIPYAAGSGELSIPLAVVFGMVVACVWLNISRRGISLDAGTCFALGGTVGIVGVITNTQLILFVAMGILLIEPIDMRMKRRRAGKIGEVVLERAPL